MEWLLDKISIFRGWVGWGEEKRRPEEKKLLPICQSFLLNIIIIFFVWALSTRVEMVEIGGNFNVHTKKKWSKSITQLTRTQIYRQIYRDTEKKNTGGGGDIVVVNRKHNYNTAGSIMVIKKRITNRLSWKEKEENEVEMKIRNWLDHTCVRWRTVHFGFRSWIQRLGRAVGFNWFLFWNIVKKN